MAGGAMVLLPGPTIGGGAMLLLLEGPIEGGCVIVLLDWAGGGVGAGYRLAKLDIGAAEEGGPLDPGGGAVVVGAPPLELGVA